MGECGILIGIPPEWCRILCVPASKEARATEAEIRLGEGKGCYRKETVVSTVTCVELCRSIQHLGLDLDTKTLLKSCFNSNF